MCIYECILYEAAKGFTKPLKAPWGFINPPLVGALQSTPLLPLGED